MKTLWNIFIGIIIGFLFGRFGGQIDYQEVFNKLGSAKNFVVQKYENYKTSNQSKETEKVSSKGDMFVVQVASFRDKTQAKSFIRELNQDEIDAYLAPRRLAQHKGRYRVFVGEYIDKSRAVKKLHQLRSKFPKAFLSSL